MTSATEAPTFSSYAEFYPYYLSQHSKPLTRMVHAAGTGLAVLIAAKAIVRGPRRRIWRAKAVGYAAAWTAHFAIEGNKPTSWGGNPVWSLAADFNMLFDMARGRNAELQQIADAYAHRDPADEGIAAMLEDFARTVPQPLPEDEELVFEAADFTAEPTPPAAPPAAPAGAPAQTSSASTPYGGA